MDSLLLFLHITKTGGNTINEYLEAHSPYYKQATSEASVKIDVRKLKGLGSHFCRIHHKEIFKRARNNFNLKYMTILRNPLERMVSLYNWSVQIGRLTRRANHHKVFLNFIRDKKNYQGFFLNKSLKYIGINLKAEQFIDRCWFVTTTDKVTEDFKLICKIFNTPSTEERINITKTKLISLTPQYEKIIRKVGKFDFKLYELAQHKRLLTLPNLVKAVNSGLLV